jgi:arylsulfatase A-like enzyme
LAAETTSRWPVVYVVAAIFLSPLVVRAMLLIENHLTFRAGDLRGIALDVAVSLPVATAVVFLMKFERWGRPAATVLVALWCVINFANYEHIRELGSMARLTYAGYLADPTFLLGSGFAFSHPLILFLVVIVSCAVVWVSPQGLRSGRFWLVVLIAAVIFGASAVMPRDGQLSEWRQSNVVAAQVGRLLAAAAGRGVPTVALHRNVQADLGGESIIESPPRGSNVLLIILEGVSGAYLPSLRARHDQNNRIGMPQLDRIAESGLSWSTFINHQRQTNRGEYALLCGDYPKLVGGESKMTELVGAGRLDCLPAILQDFGYATTYLQAAPMSYMLKDQFMPQAGFETAVGERFFKRSYNRNQWGIDDLAFFEQSLGMVEQLQRDEHPWFLTLLTVGTHHPFNAPEDFDSDYERGSAGWAMDYLDHAIGFFIRELEDRGVLKDTLVLITSDESRETKPGASDEASMLSQSWGFLIALTPSGDSGVVDEPFMQLDVPISVLDYLDFSDPANRLGGRSVFRTYATTRDLFWGNTYLDLVAGLSSTGELAFCDGAFRTCRGTRLAGRDVFAPGIELSSLDPSTVGWLQRGVEESMLASVAANEDRELLLMRPGSTPLREGYSLQYVFGGQFLSIPAGIQAEIEIEMELVGPIGGAVRFSHNLIIDWKQQYLRTGRLGVGQAVRIRYTVLSEVTVNNVDVRFWLEEANMSGLEIVTKTARINMSSPRSTDLPYGLTEYEFRIIGFQK